MRKKIDYSHDNTNYMLNLVTCEPLQPDRDTQFERNYIEAPKMGIFGSFQMGEPIKPSYFSQHNSYYHYGTSDYGVLQLS